MHDVNFAVKKLMLLKPNNIFCRISWLAEDFGKYTRALSRCMAIRWSSFPSFFGAEFFAALSVRESALLGLALSVRGCAWLWEGRSGYANPWHYRDWQAPEAP